MQSYCLPAFCIGNLSVSFSGLGEFNPLHFAFFIYVSDYIFLFFFFMETPPELMMVISYIILGQKSIYWDRYCRITSENELLNVLQI